MFSRAFLATYSSRVKVHHATAIRTKALDLRMNLDTVGTQSVKDKAVRDRMAVKSACSGILTATYCLQQIRAMGACFGLSQC